MDAATVRYYAAFVQLRCALITATAVSRGGGALGLAAYMAPHHRFLRQLAADLAEAVGSPLPALPGVLPASEATALDDSAIEGLRSDVLPTLRDPVARLRTRAAMLTLEHHRAASHLGALVLADDEADLRASLGSATSAGELPAFARAAGTRGDIDVLAVLYRRTQRALWLWDTPSAAGPTVVRPPARPPDGAPSGHGRPEPPVGRGGPRGAQAATGTLAGPATLDICTHRTLSRSTLRSGQRRYISSMATRLSRRARWAPMQ